MLSFLSPALLVQLVLWPLLSIVVFVKEEMYQVSLVQIMTVFSLQFTAHRERAK